MRNYSISYLDAHGVTVTSEFVPFEDNTAAIAFARIGLLRHAFVEVWHQNLLIGRLYQSGAMDLPLGSNDAGDSQPTIAATVLAVRHKAVDEWSNEGGASSARPADGVHR